MILRYPRGGLQSCLRIAAYMLAPTEIINHFIDPAPSLLYGLQSYM